MAIDEEDLTGKPPTREEVAQARAVVMRFRVDLKWGMNNPELFVYLGSIDRCLALAATVAKPRG